MSGQAVVLLRSSMEALFKLKAMTLDNEILKQYAVEALLNQIALAEVMNNLYINYDGKYYTEDEIIKLRSRLRELKTQKRGRTYKRWLPSEWAEKAGLKEFYLMQYKLFTQPVHATASHTAEYMVKNPAGELEEFNPLPQFSLINGYLHTNLAILLLALECVAPFAKRKHGKASIKTRLKHIDKQMKTLANINHGNVST